jgi:hypothetical protein
MSSFKRPASVASAASTVSPLDPSVVKFGDYLDRVYVSNMEESEAAYAAHIKASNELHEAEIAMMRSKRAVRALNAELNKATAEAASATEIVDRKRKAADEAAADFDSTARITRHCYGTEGKRRAPSPTSPVYRPTSPAYSKVLPVYSKAVATIEAAEETQLTVHGGETPSFCPCSPSYRPTFYRPASPAYSKVLPVYSKLVVEHESQDPSGGDTTPSYNPVSKDYVPQNPCGDGNSPVYRSPNGYCHITGEPIYSPTHPTNPTSPRYSATSPKYSATSPPRPISPHVIAAAKRSTLRWGA